MHKPEHNEKLLVRTFGGLTFYRRGAPVSIIWESQKARHLFCYLLVSREQWVSGDKLIGMLWPGCVNRDGANNFKTTLSRLRKSFTGPQAINPVITSGDVYRINGDVMEIDAGLFRQKALEGIKLFARGEAKGARGCLEAAQDLYTGEFLPEEPDDNCIGAERRELAGLHGMALRYLGEIYRKEGDPQALEAFLYLNRSILEGTS
ncbi:MAG TPA: DNA-binding protein [Geobacteraceae bacterium]|nr:DNA-binding protein [Geobacteraceae bacterium]